MHPSRDLDFSQNNQLFVTIAPCDSTTAPALSRQDLCATSRVVACIAKGSRYGDFRERGTTAGAGGPTADTVLITQMDISVGRIPWLLVLALTTASAS